MPCRVGRCAGWQGILRGKKTRPGEWLAERGIFLVSLSAILIVFLIFLFVAREALPVALGRMNSAAVAELIPVEDMETVPPAKLRRYLGLKEKDFAAMSAETKRELMRVKLEEFEHAPKDPDAALNTIRWRHLLLPHQWSGYDKPEFIWQPVSQIHKYNIVPLVIGSLKATVVALLFAVPLALGAAIYVSQLASPGLKEYLKPGIEMLAGIPDARLSGTDPITGFWQNIDQVRALGFDDRFIRLWHYYLCYCEAGFLERQTGVAQMLLARPDCQRAPLLWRPA